jgi:hypothetical protein
MVSNKFPLRVSLIRMKGKTGAVKAVSNLSFLKNVKKYFSFDN